MFRYAVKHGPPASARRTHRHRSPPAVHHLRHPPKPSPFRPLANSTRSGCATATQSGRASRSPSRRTSAPKACTVPATEPWRKFTSSTSSPRRPATSPASPTGPTSPTPPPIKPLPCSVHRLRMTPPTSPTDVTALGLPQGGRAEAGHRPLEARPSAAAVGAQIRRRREQRGMSGSELARRAGLSKATLSQLEAGRSNPTTRRLTRSRSRSGFR